MSRLLNRPLPDSGRSPRRPVAAICLALSSLALMPCPGALADGNAARQVMADAMSRMMEAMGLFGTGSDWARSFNPGSMPYPPYGMGNPGAGMPFGGGSPMDGYGRMGRDWMDRFSGAMGSGRPWGGSSLDGVWEAAAGGLLLIQGENFRLYSPSWSVVDGKIRTQGDRLRMVNPNVGFDLELEYAQDGGRLVMRDSSGQLYLYRLVVLDGGEGGAPGR